MPYFQVLREVNKLGLLDGGKDDVRPFAAGVVGGAGVGVGAAVLYDDDTSRTNLEEEDDEDEEDEEDNDEEDVKDDDDDDEDEEDGMEYSPEKAAGAMKDVEQHT